MTDEDVAGFLPLARHCAARIAWLPEHIDDLVQVGLLALLNAARCRDDIKNPSGFASIVFRRAMQDSYSRAEREDQFVQPEDNIPVYIAVVNIEPLAAIIATDTESEIQHFFRAVDCALGSRIGRLARNYYNPDEGVQWLADRDGRAITNVHIRKHLHISEDQWPQEIRKLRDFTAAFFKTQNGEPVATHN